MTGPGGDWGPHGSLDSGDTLPHGLMVPPFAVKDDYNQMCSPAENQRTGIAMFLKCPQLMC